MSKHIKDINNKIIEEDKVRLKPFLGISPGKYLAFIYSIILVVILFFIFLYPGLSNPGELLYVNSEPQGAAVRVNNVYMASTPGEVFIPKGKHSIQIVLPGFNAWQDEMEFGSRAFGSRFFPLGRSLYVELRSHNPINAFKEAAVEFAAWSFYGEATQAFQVPMVLSSNAYRLAREAVDHDIQAGMKETIKGAARYAITRAGLRDIVRANFLIDSFGQSSSPLGILRSLESMYGFLKDNPESAFWLAQTLPEQTAGVLTASSWYKNTNNTMGEYISENGLVFHPAFSSSSGQTYNFLGLRFREINVFFQDEAIYTNQTGFSPPHTSSFLIAETPLPLDLWYLFLEESPNWRIENHESLLEYGLVDTQYLAYSDFPGLPANTTAWVSWHAAKAFCEWFGSKLEMEVRLPYEFEWEMAVITGLDMVGDFWEWCQESFVPINYLPAPLSHFDFDIEERSVRGGSWINPQHTVSIETRGALPPDSCSPFVSFRPVIVVSRNIP